MDPLQAQIRQVFFFDTPDLALDQAGVVVRARRIQGKGDDSVVKLRPVVPAELPAELRDSPNFRVEVDALPGRLRLLRLAEAAARRDRGPEHPGGRAPATEALLEGAARVLRRHAPEGIALDDLTVSARSSCSSCGSTPRGARTPDRRRDVALPGRLARARALHPVRDRTRPSRSPPRRARSWRSRGVDLSGEQQTKTRKALSTSPSTRSLLRDAPLRGNRRRHQLGQAPRRRASRGR